MSGDSLFRCSLPPGMKAHRRAAGPVLAIMCGDGGNVLNKRHSPHLELQKHHIRVPNFNFAATW